MSSHLAPQTRRQAPTIATLDDKIMHCELLRLVKEQAVEIPMTLSCLQFAYFPDGVWGDCEWRSGDRIWRTLSVPANTAVFCPKWDDLRLGIRSARASCRIFLLTIAPNAFEGAAAGGSELVGLEHVQQVRVTGETLCHTLSDLLQEVEAPGLNSRFYAQSLLALLLSQLVRYGSSRAHPDKLSPDKGGLPPWRLKRALALLEDGACKPHSLAEIAERLGLHPASVCRAFKRSTGMTPHQYMLSYRIERAKEMMERSDRTLTQIALACGFANSSQFSVAFRRIVGVSPREYRLKL